jgi:signal transduction histidine kinase
LAEEEPRGSHAPIVWGAFILFIGIVLLLQVTGVLEWRIWGTLWKFWPVLIIVIGLSLFLPRRYGWLMTLLTLAIFGICLWISALQYVPNLSHDVTLVEQRFTYPVIGVEQVSARIESGTGLIFIADLLQTDQQLLCEINDSRDFQNKPEKRILTMETDFTRNNGTVTVNVKPVEGKSWDDWLVSWGLRFSQHIPLSLDVSGDGSRFNMRLESLDVEKLRLEMDVCSGWLTLPTSAGETTIDIDMDVSNLEITVPEGVAVKIKADINLSVFNINTERFPRQGDYFISPDYASATNRIELNVLCDVSRLTIK